MERPRVALHPEKIQSQDLIVERTFKPWLQVMTEVFYNDLSNLIDQQPDAESGLSSFVNSGRYKARGFGAEAEVKRTSGLSAQASYTFANAEGDGIQLANAPIHLVKLKAALPLSNRAVTGIEMLYTSSQITPRGGAVDSVWLTNLTLSSKRTWKGWDISASCYNAFDQKWYSSASVDHRMESIEQDGRSFRLKVSYRLSKNGESK